ncbi:thiol-disulfide isomerase/thioredoxin [Oikeobacillus pervagus]|uniref:Thiol-disulfide isomerase/thioredoxin n=1 Tax=Oikeobacillus pervagus TaxID=1325931 RepID=A0AAJ1WGG6_9BACI|nr:thioredoxin family protein [Oikeobacillus pervagus]MDQ0215042.1 thiol-disulfide isomerase/thioredoxin [Oikeobacillus pervagus]
MEKLKSIEEFSTLKNSGKYIFLFTADWCPDCQVIKPFLPEIEESYSQFTFIYVDRDDFIDLCGELDVFGIPSFLAYDHGQELGRFVSKDRKSREEIEQFLESLNK